MANRVYLIAANSPTPVELLGISAFPEVPISQVLVAASNCLPPLWLACFTEADVVAKTMTLNDGSPFSYSYGIVDTALARQRVRARSDQLLAALSVSGETSAAVRAAIDQWPGFLDGVDTTHIHLEGYELMIMIPDGFDDLFRTSLRAFTLPLMRSGQTLPREWLEMLDVAQISPERPEEIEAHQLRGYAWERPVPWAE
jgi:hypothetical protein